VKNSKRRIAFALNDIRQPSMLVRAFLRKVSLLDHPTIVHLPRSVPGFFALLHFGSQAASASTRRGFPCLPVDYDCGYLGPVTSYRCWRAAPASGKMR